MTTNPIVFVVDDDPAIGDALKALLETDGLMVEVYGGGQEFLNAYDPAFGGCLLLDVEMPGMDGLELQARLAEIHGALSIVIITAHGDVPRAVKALKAGAIDFIEKPFTDERILDCVRRALEVSERSRREQALLGDANAGVARLTPRERDVLEQLVIGRANKVIAFELGISARTVEIYRARVMEKMAARNLSHLVRMGLALGMNPESP